MEILNTHKGQRTDGELTICEKHRQLADLLILRLAEKPHVLDEVMPVLDGAYQDGIKLVKVLIDRKLQMPEWGRHNPALAAQLRQQRIQMVKELNASGHCL